MSTDDVLFDWDLWPGRICYGRWLADLPEMSEQMRQLTEGIYKLMVAFSRDLVHAAEALKALSPSD